MNGTVRWLRILAVLGIVMSALLSGGAVIVQAAPVQSGGSGQSLAQEVSDEGVTPEAAPSDSTVAETPVAEESPTLVETVTDDPATDVPAEVEPTDDVTEPETDPGETVGQTPDLIETETPYTPDATENVQPAADDAVDAAAVPTYIFPDPNVVGTVNVSMFACTGRSATTFDVDVIAAAASLPSGPGSCSPAPGKFTFTFLGGLPNSAQIIVHNSGSIDLPAGTYDVADEASGSHTTIVLGNGQVINMMVYGPLVGAPPTVAAGDGTVTIAVVDCTNVRRTVFDIDQISAAASHVDCTNSTATVTFYMVGDGTADYVQRVIAQSGAISLHPGVYEVVVENTQAHVFITVPANGVVSMVIMKPMAAASGAISGSSVGADSGAEGDGVTTPSLSGTSGIDSTGDTQPAADVTTSAPADSTAIDSSQLPAEGSTHSVGTDEADAVQSVQSESRTTVKSPIAGSQGTVKSAQVTNLPRAGTGIELQDRTPLAWLLLALSSCSLILAATSITRGRDRS